VDWVVHVWAKLSMLACFSWPRGERAIVCPCSPASVGPEVDKCALHGCALLQFGPEGGGGGVSDGSAAAVPLRVELRNEEAGWTGYTLCVCVSGKRTKTKHINNKGRVFDF